MVHDDKYNVWTVILQTYESQLFTSTRLIPHSNLSMVNILPNLRGASLHYLIGLVCYGHKATLSQEAATVAKPLTKSVSRHGHMI